MRQPLRRIDRDRVRRVRVCIAHVTACCREPEFRRSGYGAELASTGCVEDCPARVVDLTRVLGLAQSTVSGHLACLRDCGLVTARPAGRASVYSLAQPALLDLLAAAEMVLQATGSAVTRCLSNDGTATGDSGLSQRVLPPAVVPMWACDQVIGGA